MEEELNSLSDWWTYLDTNWEDVEPLLKKYLAPVAYDEARELHLRRGDPMRLVQLLSDAWWNLPDNQVIHSFPGFYPLCDLCSEFKYSW